MQRKQQINVKQQKKISPKQSNMKNSENTFLFFIERYTYKQEKVFQAMRTSNLITKYMPSLNEVRDISVRRRAGKLRKKIV